MKIYNFIEKEELINEFAKEMAYIQKKADKYYYIEENKEMADFMLNYATEVKELAIRLGICNEMYEKAYKHYDFRNSGKRDYVPGNVQLQLLREWSGLR